MTKTAEFYTLEFAESYKRRAEETHGYEMKLVEKDGKFLVIDEKSDD